MHDYQREFIKFAIETQVLKFGEFTLKSGRVSPYFLMLAYFVRVERYVSWDTFMRLR